MESLSSVLNIGGSLYQGASKFMGYCAGSQQTLEYNPIFVKELEPLSLIVSLAIASLMPKNSKPSLSNHRITWHPPIPVGSNTISFDLQAPKRTLCNALGYEISEHKVIIPLFKESIEKALKIYFSHDLSDIAMLTPLFAAAAAGLKKLTSTYATEEDGTIDKIEACIKSIEDALKGSEKVMSILKSQSIKIKGSPLSTPTNSPANSPSNSIQNSKNFLKENEITENKTSQPSQTKAKALPEKKSEIPSSSSKGNKGTKEIVKENKHTSNKPVESSQKASIEFEFEKEVFRDSDTSELQNASEYNSELLACINPYSSSKLTPLEKGIKMIWDEQFYYLQSIERLFNKASILFEDDRANSPQFKNSVTAIESLVNIRCSDFEALLEENSKNGLEFKEQKNERRESNALQRL